MTTEIATTNGDAIMERVLLAGDLARLTPAERVRYYGETCRSLGLNPLTQPFQYLLLNGKLQLYATKAATDQLRKHHGISITDLQEQLTDAGVFKVTATAVDAHGRTDRDMGAVSVAGLRGEALCNAMLKCVTKAKRRVTLSICGLGWLDELEVDSIPDARRVVVDTTTGEIATEDMPAAMPLARQAVPPWPDLPPRAPVGQPARTRSREVPEGKRWSEAQLAWFWASLGDLRPRVTGDEVHAILGVESIHDWPDLDDALERVREARQNPSHTMSAEAPIPPSEDAPEAEDEESLGSVLDHPDGSIEREWQRYNAVAKLALAWNKDYPEQSVKWNAPERDGTAAHVRGTAEGLERRLSKLLGTRRSAP
jgi:hypothetical protein